MQSERERRRQGWVTLVAIVAIVVVTLVALWMLSYVCMTPPSSPLNLSNWTCGPWSAFLGVGLVVAAAFLVSAAWAAYRRRLDR